MFETRSNLDRELDASDYNSSGDLTNTHAELSLVVGSASRAEEFIANKQWSLMWRDADLLFQSPRPMSVYENTYVLEPNVQRFTVAKTVNAIVPQLYKGLFYTDPPILMRPRPNTKQAVVDAKTALFAYLLEACCFKTETKWGLEQMAHLGTGIWKWGIDWKEVVIEKRKASQTVLKAGPDNAQTATIPTESMPEITVERKIVPRPFFESRPLTHVLVDPKCDVGDIQHADFAVDVKYMDFYDLQILQKAIRELPEDHIDKKGWDFPKTEKGLQDWWLPPTTAGQIPELQTDQAGYVQGLAFHAEDPQVTVTPDILRKKKEVLEYWDKKRKILVIDRLHVIYSGENKFGKLPFFSANWWNRPKSLYGMGIGLTVGMNQRVDQGGINAILKLLSFGVNPVYLRRRDANAPTQMIRTGLGKILTVDGDTKGAYELLETPKVPPDTWSALAESEKATESTSGADQQLVQGSSAGPRSSMGRTAGGAGILANASATRLDGPLDNFIEQVFKPFLYELDSLVFRYFSDAEIFSILGEELGNDFEVDLQDFHDAKIEYEVLAGSSLAAKRTMAQSMTLITQIFSNPEIQNNLAEINGEYIDFKPILSMWMEASEWKNKQDIIKPLTPAMQQKRQQQSEAAQAQNKASIAQQSEQQKFEAKTKLEDQANENRIKRDIVREAFRANGMNEAVEGAPSVGGLDGMQDSVQ